jgi:hypothetical protein
MPARRTQLARTKRVAPRNPTRSKKAHARNYGEEAATIRLMPCLAEGRGLARCMGPIHVAHVTARGRGGCKGGRFDIVPLCAAHHRLAGEAGTSDRVMFEKLHSLDLRAEADRIALLHSEPLGLRAVARRWVALLEAIDDTSVTHDSLAFAGRLDAAPGAYERDALLGWVRRRLVAESGHRDREDLAHAVMLELGWETLGSDPSGEHGIAWSLCESAGWP